MCPQTGRAYTLCPVFHWVNLPSGLCYLPPPGSQMLGRPDAKPHLEVERKATTPAPPGVLLGRTGPLRLRRSSPVGTSAAIPTPRLHCGGGWGSRGKEVRARSLYWARGKA